MWLRFTLTGFKLLTGLPITLQLLRFSICESEILPPANHHVKGTGAKRRCSTCQHRLGDRPNGSKTPVSDALNILLSKSSCDQAQTRLCVDDCALIIQAARMGCQGEGQNPSGAERRQIPPPPAQCAPTSGHLISARPHGQTTLPVAFAVIALGLITRTPNQCSPTSPTL
jgi:hypothetical protein